jgi:hypothetical protein
MSGSKKEVRFCPSEDCPLHEYRLGRYREGAYKKRVLSEEDKKELVKRFKK